MHEQEQDDNEDHDESKADVADRLGPDALVALPLQVVAGVRKRPIPDDPMVRDNLTNRVHRPHLETTTARPIIIEILLGEAIA